nr:MAG TPA: tyrosine-protein kinase [Caudoviricetes sp.]
MGITFDLYFGVSWCITRAHEDGLPNPNKCSV